MEKPHLVVPRKEEDHIPRGGDRRGKSKEPDAPREWCINIPFTNIFISIKRKPRWK